MPIPFRTLGTLFRMDPEANTDSRGNPVPGWVEEDTDVPSLLQSVKGVVVQMAPGRSEEATHRGLFPPGHDIQPDWAYVVTGLVSGSALPVEQQQRFRFLEVDFRGNRPTGGAWRIQTMLKVTQEKIEEVP